jgi:hypothetical protein
MSYEEAVRECERLDATDRFTEHLPVEAKPGEWKVSSRLRADWRSRSTSDRLDRPVKQGERFVAARDIEVNVMTHWRAPFTGGNRATLPAGTVVAARFDQNPEAPGFTCAPEDYERLEPILVPAEDRRADNYGGYSISFVLDDIGTNIEPLS